MNDDMTQIRDALRVFASERAWGQYHTPKNLATALSVEAGELLEHFQWLTGEESCQVSGDRHEAIAMEMADVLIYLIQIADRLDVDLAQAARKKIGINANKYPVSQDNLF